MDWKKTLDLSKIPLSALKEPTQTILSSGLNQTKILPNSNGLPRDWRGVAHLIGLNGSETGWIATKSDPFSALLNYWGKNGNLNLLQNYLGIIDRYDVLDDTKDLFENNGLEYMENLEKLNVSVTDVNLHTDQKILTTDDVIRLKNGMEPQIYDAYVLHAEEDANFAAEIVDTMESKYNFKLCIRDRNLIGGVQFEHDAITKLIAERCRRLVVIVSSNFLKSKANKFFVTFAQALALDIRERKVIPILYEKCNVPPELSYYFFLDYNRASKLWNFWEKLRDSIQGPEPSEKTVKAISAETPNEYWISRTHFEGKSEEAAGTATDEQERESENLKTSNKKKNMYKIIKNSFGRAVKSSSNDNQDTSNPNSKSNSLMENLATFTSSDNVYFENLENSSSFEVSDINMKSKKIKKKKWFRKKNLETLLS